MFYGGKLRLQSFGAVERIMIDCANFSGPLSFRSVHLKFNWLNERDSLYNVRSMY